MRGGWESDSLDLGLVSRPNSLEIRFWVLMLGGE